eukprot:GHVN01063787.1.p1 GENE.GHVN01063787.1~~GHVN01063787.1.p1  ORF type:complete len:109 (-),score=1.49 GHVN01063787.1:30-356(-)
MRFVSLKHIVEISIEFQNAPGGHKCHQIQPIHTAQGDDHHCKPYFSASSTRSNQATPSAWVLDHETILAPWFDLTGPHLWTTSRSFCSERSFGRPSILTLPSLLVHLG